MVQVVKRRLIGRSRIVFGVTDYQSIRLLGNVPKLLAEKDWEVFVVANMTSTEDVPQAAWLNYYHLPMKRTPAPFRDLISLIRWTALLRRIRPDAVSVGTPKAALLGLLAAKVWNVPHRVYVLRGLRLQTAKGPGWAGLWLAEWLTSFMATKIVSVSQSLASKYTHLGLAQADRILVLGQGSSHGVVMDTALKNQMELSRSRNRRKLGLEPGLPVLGFAGRFTYDKGVDFLAHTRNYLLESGCDHEMVIVGQHEDSDNHHRELLNFARPTRFLGPFSNALEHIALFDLLLLPSRREGFPNVILEAASLGIPSVITAVTGSVDAVINGHTGWIAESNTKEDFAKKVLVAVTNAKERVKMGKRAREWVGANFKREFVEDLHVNIYEQLRRG